jgi:methyl-accepting chemotaxis protein/sigma-B regulation protein RsbU (phosphoserine phosphatase)
MMAGETGDTLFRANSQDWYVFYKPFLQNKHSSRAMSRLNWSVAVVYSEAEIFGSFNYMLLYVLAISVTGLFLFFLLIRIVAHLQMQPVRLLSKATQRIAEGHYDDSMPDIRRNDEIGLLYQRFQLMEQSLAAHVNELGQLTTTLKKRREVLREVNAKEQSVDRVKTSFFHFVTNQMIAPSESIQHYINILCHHYIELSPEEISQVVDSIDKKSDTVIELINNMLEAADSEAGKEAAHD